MSELGPHINRFSPPATPGDALAVLRDGNERHRSGRRELRDYSPVGQQMANSQKPFAAIVACADSRVSPTLIFDLAQGNLFVSRVAGNTIGAEVLGGTEFAVAMLGVKLIMVMGHSDCGAVRAALDVASGAAGFPADRYGSIGAMLVPIVPAIESLPGDQRSLERATAANAAAQAQAIASTVPVIEAAVAAGSVQVVSAVYDIATGAVAVST
jgi:carbonic anhydrase